MTRGRDYRRAERHRRLQRIADNIDEIIHRHAPALIHQSPNATLDPRGLQAILDDLEAEFPVERIKRARIILRSRLQQLKATTTGKIAVPSPETYIRRDPSPFSRDKLAKVVQLEGMLSLFEQEINTDLDIQPSLIKFKRRKDEPENLTKQRRNDRYRRALLGRLLFSSIVNGGLLNRNLVKDLFSAFSVSLMAHDGIAWVSFDLSSTPKSEYGNTGGVHIDPDGPVRRWFPDPVTLGLIRHWRSHYNTPEIRDWACRESPAACLKTYIACLRRLRGRSHQPTNLRDSIDWLRSAAHTRLSLHLPQVLVNFLWSLDAGSSMTERSWWRYQFDLLLVAEQEPAHEIGALRDAPDEESPEIPEAEQLETSGSRRQDAETRVPEKVNKSYFESQDRIASMLRKCLAHPSGARKYAPTSVAKQNIKNLISERGKEMAPILMAIAKWALWRLDPHPHDDDIKPVSVERYLNRITGPLVFNGVEISLDEESTEIWEDFYADVLDSIESSTDRAKAAENLRSFHRFIMENRSAPPCSIAGESVARSHGRICVISESDYLRTLTALSRTGSSLFLRHTAFLIVILMYRIGLRPEEIITLQFSHIQGVTEQDIRRKRGSPTIYLKTSYRQSLKTPSSLRQIPLAWFLEDGELETFLDYLSRRLNSIRGQELETIPVFGNGFGSIQRLGTQAVFSHISSILKQVTGDYNVVPYTLRHTCFTRTFNQTMNQESADENAEHSFLRNGQAPREAVYSISVLAGHLDPDVSLGTYIHSQDICAFHWIKAVNADLPLRTWATLEGKAYITLTTRRSRRKSRGLNPDAVPAWADLTNQTIKHLNLEAPLSRSGTLVSICEEPLDERSIVHLSLQGAHSLLMALNRRMSHASRAVIFEVPEAEIKALEARARSVKNRLSGFREANDPGADSSKKENSRKARPRLVRHAVPWNRLPPIHTGAQPGMLGPGLPTQKEERAEAQRIFQLLCKQAREQRESPNFIVSRILTPIQVFHDHLYRSGAAVRFTDSKAFSSFCDLLRRIGIEGKRIEVSVLSLPAGELGSISTWQQKLKSMAGFRSILFRSAENRPPRSIKHPDFGSVSIRILSASLDLVSSEKESSRVRSGSGWRVGLTYAGLFISSALSANVFLQKASLKSSETG